MTGTSLNVGNLQAQLGMNTGEFDAGIAKAQAETAGFAGKFTSLIGGLVVPIAAVGAAMAAVGAASVASADTIDQSYASIRVGTGATGEALESLKDDFHAVYGEIPASAEAVGIAIADLNTRLGLTGEPLQQIATQVLELSRITKTDLASNIASATRVMGDWSIANENAGKSIDYIFNVSQRTGASVAKISDQLVQYGAPLRQMGFDFETSAALMGKFEKEGVNAELVLGSLRIALGDMAREGVTDTKKALELLIEDIKKAGSVGEANALALEVFGARAGPDMAAAIREGRFEIADLMESIEKSPDTIMEAADDAKTLGDRIGELTASMNEELEPLGMQIIDAIEPLIDKAKELLPVVGGALDTLIGLWDENSGEVMGWAGQIRDALVGIGEGLLEFWQENGPAIMTVVDQVMETLGGAWDALLPHIENGINAAQEFLGTILPQIGAWWDENGDTIMKAFDQVVEWITIGLGILMEAVGVAWPYIEFTISGTLQNILDLVTAVSQLITGDWQGFSDTVQGITERMQTIQIELFKGLANGIISIINSITKAWNVLKFTVPEVTIPYVGTFGGFEMAVPQIPEIPFLAAGGIVTAPTLAVIGERGPEAIVPLDNAIGERVIRVDVDGRTILEILVDLLRREGVNIG